MTAIDQDATTARALADKYEAAKSLPLAEVYTWPSLLSPSDLAAWAREHGMRLVGGLHLEGAFDWESPIWLRLTVDREGDRYVGAVATCTSHDALRGSIALEPA